MADRYLYLPSIGIAVMIFSGFLCWLKMKRSKSFFAARRFDFFAVLSGMTWHQCGFWKNSEALFRNASRINEENALAHINYGNALAGEGRLEEAVVYYNKAWGMLPETGGNVMAYNKMGIAENKLRQLIDVSLGNVYTKQKKYQEAVHHYTRAIAMRPITPDHVRTYNFRGRLTAAWDGRKTPSEILMKPSVWTDVITGLTTTEDYCTLKQVCTGRRCRISIRPF